jgi:UrcA family protein
MKMRDFVGKISLVAVLALAAVPAIGLTQAAQAAQPVAHIKIGDLRLSRPSHAVEFNRRVDAAGDEVCAVRARQEGLRGLSLRACRIEFGQDARAELSRAQLSDLRRGERAGRVMLSAR